MGDANEVRADAYRQAQNALTNNTFHDVAAKTTYLQDIHKAIAIKRIEMYLQDHNGRGVIDGGDLPDRVPGDVAAGALAHTNVNNYRDYAAFIRNSAYHAGQINAFVAEICGKINLQRVG